MAESLIAILLVTGSAKGSSIVYQWPPNPSGSTRLCRPRPVRALSQLDNQWLTSQSHRIPFNIANERFPEPDLSNDYVWQRPIMDRNPPLIPDPIASSRSASPTRSRPYDIDANIDEDKELLGYPAKFLASVLCPQHSSCHQKFELVIDDLAFIGHPVSFSETRSDGTPVWKFRDSQLNRGRVTTTSQMVPPGPTLAAQTSGSWLQIFHVVLVLDQPDPSSSASGNVDKYFNVIYEQIAFTMTAVLFQEQVDHNFVERECDALLNLKDSDSLTRADVPLEAYLTEAQTVSSIASAIKDVFTAIKSSSMAYITLNGFPLELQIPPHLDTLLHMSEDTEALAVLDESSGWRHPAPEPWKSLILLDDTEPYTGLRGPYTNEDDEKLAEDLLRFLDQVSVTLSLAEMASLVDWDFETQVVPTVKWLVHHRRAKIVDRIHSNLKTVFTLPPRFDAPIRDLTVDFAEAFAGTDVPPLPVLLTTAVTEGENFFVAVVRSKERIPLYTNVLLWMLRHGLVVPLHLRIRVVATVMLKKRVREAEARHRDRRRVVVRRSSELSNERAIASSDDSEEGGESGEEEGYFFRLGDDEDDDEGSSEHTMSGDGGVGLEEDTEDGDDTPSIILDPARPRRREQAWLSAMSEGKESYLRERFEKIYQFFDGKRTDDEILYRADIKRRHLREVLQHYEEYLQTFLHPS